MRVNMEDIIAMYKGGGDLLADAKAIIDAARSAAYRSVNVALVQRNWLLGKRISEEDLKGAARAEYGKQVIQKLASQLTAEYGKGFDFGGLYKFLQFYKKFPILDSLSPKSGGLLSWTHYRKLLQVENKDALAWYINETAAEGWGVRVLQRNISSQYYERMLLSRQKELVRSEMHEVAGPLQERLEFIKNPVIAEFLGFKEDASFTESDLESRILDNIREFLMEMGKGYKRKTCVQRLRRRRESSWSRWNDDYRRLAICRESTRRQVPRPPHPRLPRLRGRARICLYCRAKP